MHTIYLKKNCIVCKKALINLYNRPDLSTNIVIVNSRQSKILLLDKRVKKFPFIINSLPTSIGLIPRKSFVYPLEFFINRLKPSEKNNNKYTKIKKIKKEDGGVDIIIN